MEFAFRTDTKSIREVASILTDEDIKTLTNKKTQIKKNIRPYVIPSKGVINGDTLQDLYFPSSMLDGQSYDVFISHSHNNETEAKMLAVWLEKHRGLSCFVDSFVWGSADQLLKEIDNKCCVKKWDKNGNSYYYNKRNFTTSHVHAILSMALLESIQKAKYCIFIESKESVHLNNKIKKETLSPWLYEEIKFMKLFQPQRETKLFSEMMEKAVVDCKIAYDVTDISEFPFLDSYKLAHFCKDRAFLND